MSPATIRLFIVSIASIAAHFFLLTADQQEEMELAKVSIASIAAHFFLLYVVSEGSPEVLLSVSIASIAAHFFLPTSENPITEGQQNLSLNRLDSGALLLTFSRSTQ